jgi:hypothetical protein
MKQLWMGEQSKMWAPLAAFCEQLRVYEERPKSKKRVGIEKEFDANKKLYNAPDGDAQNDVFWDVPEPFDLGVSFLAKQWVPNGMDMSVKKDAIGRYVFKNQLHLAAKLV